MSNSSSELCQQVVSVCYGHPYSTAVVSSLYKAQRRQRRQRRHCHPVATPPSEFPFHNGLPSTQCNGYPLQWLPSAEFMFSLAKTWTMGDMMPMLLKFTL
jgi:hypothetical protein